MPWGRVLTSRNGAQGLHAHHLTMARRTLEVRSVSRPTSLAESKDQRQSHSWPAAEPGWEPKEKCRVAAPSPGQRSNACFYE